MTTERKPRTALATLGWYGTRQERDDFKEYWNRGGTLSFNQWKKKGKPPATPSAQPEWLTSRTRGVMGTPEYAEAEAARRAGLPREVKQPSPKPTGETETEKGAREYQESQDWEKTKWEREFGLKEKHLLLMRKDDKGRCSAK